MITLSMSSCQREPLEEAIPEKPTTTKANLNRKVAIYVYNYSHYQTHPLDIDVYGLWLKATSFGRDGYVGSCSLADMQNLEEGNSFIVGMLGAKELAVIDFNTWKCDSGNATLVNSSGHLAMFRINNVNDTTTIRLTAMFKYPWEM